MKKLFIRSFLKSLSFFPLFFIRKIGASLLILFMTFSIKTKKRLKKNLLITGIANNSNIGFYASDSIKQWGMTLAETMTICWFRSSEYISSLVKKTSNIDILLKELELDNPILLITPHIGNFEIALKYLAHKIPTKTFTVLYKPMKEHLINQIMLDGRTRFNINPVPTTIKGVLSLVKSLNNNNIVGILPDSVSNTKDGIWVNFLKNKVFATTLVAKLSLTDNVKTYFVGCYRIKDGFDIQLIPFTPISDNYTSVVQEIYTYIEEIVLKAPEQYYWSYDRFKIPSYAKKN